MSVRNAGYPAGNATIALFLDADIDPSAGLIPITTGISEDDPQNSYSWRVDPTLVGVTYHVIPPSPRAASPVPITHPAR